MSYTLGSMLTRCCVYTEEVNHDWNVFTIDCNIHVHPRNPGHLLSQQKMHH